MSPLQFSENYEAEFVDDLDRIEISTWRPEDVVTLKRNCKAKVSYRFLCKRLEHLTLVVPGAFETVKFQKLEESLFGVPYHRRRRTT